MQGGPALASQEEGHLIFINESGFRFQKTAVKGAGDSVIFSQIHGKEGFSIGIIIAYGVLQASGQVYLKAGKDLTAWSVWRKKCQLWG